MSVKFFQPYQEFTSRAGTPEYDPIENLTKLAISLLEIDERESIHRFIPFYIKNWHGTNPKERKALEPNSLRVEGSSDIEKGSGIVNHRGPSSRIKQSQGLACSSNEVYSVHVPVSDVIRYHPLPASFCLI
ncbi:hypothetical protein F8M41_011733 [Gigaspora margarita]|uniref:Uncharacterized protein n=1 Tax=Gigaspora margarita TaxID=4874 RepID=A0A8H3WYP9_GIGMA|nr:hypothetical protein F8M41_011733 [Gigaspora margarita]